MEYKDSGLLQLNAPIVHFLEPETIVRVIQCVHASVLIVQKEHADCHDFPVMLQKYSSIYHPYSGYYHVAK